VDAVRWNGLWRVGAGTRADPNNGRLIWRLLGVNRFLWVFRRKRWHPDVRKLAQLRALYWVVIRRHPTEICGRCGGPVGMVFHVPDALWVAHCGTRQPPHGVLCMRCFDTLAERHGVGLYWSCADGVWVECAGNPCAHEEAMMEIARQRDELWRDGCDAHPEYA
jgi:hypothetical protein